MSKQRLYKPRVKYKVHSAKWWNQKYKVYESKFKSIRNRTNNYQIAIMTKKEFKNNWKNSSIFNKGDNKATRLAKWQLYRMPLSAARALSQSFLDDLYDDPTKFGASFDSQNGYYFVTDKGKKSLPDEKPAFWQIAGMTTTEFAERYNDPLKAAYHELRAQGRDAADAKAIISHDYFGSDGGDDK